MLYEKLLDYNKSGNLPFHMPGHKRNTAFLGDGLPYGIDITEIGGFDDLHDPCSILKDLSGRAARLYGCQAAFPLVNGSTGGLLAAVRCLTRPGDTIIMARNSHKAVYNAVMLNHLKPAYILPETDASSGISGSISADQVSSSIGLNPDSKLVIITSPTYEGVVSDIRGICAAAHRHNIPVLVDAAHGAHLGFSRYFPPDPSGEGADIAVVSLHKTLPALTQSALALVNSGRVDTRRLQAELSIFQTSSPSYVLLSSIDACVELLHRDKDRMFGAYECNLRAFTERVSDLKKLRVLWHGADKPAEHPAFFAFDPGKLVIVTRGTSLTGPALLESLRGSYGIELEMALSDYAVAMTSLCDTPEALNALAEALCAIDDRAAPAEGRAERPDESRLLAMALSPGDAAGLSGEALPLEASEGRLALDFVWAYPPGIPLLVPGEIIDGALVRHIGALRSAGVSVKSARGDPPGSIYSTPPR